MNQTSKSRIVVPSGRWVLRTVMLFLALSAGSMPSAAGADAGDSPWRYALKQPTNWLHESFDDGTSTDIVKWQEGRGGFGTADHASGRVMTEWTSSEIWLRQIVTMESIPSNPALYVQAAGETEIFINGSLAVKIDSATEKHTVIPLSPETVSALREGRNILAVHAKAEDLKVPRCIDVHLISADSKPALTPFTTWDKLKADYRMWLTILVTLLVLFGLTKEKPADMVFAGAIVFLSLCGVITVQEAFSGFVSGSLLMVAALFIVTAGLKETGIVDLIGSRVLGPARTELGGLILLSLFCVSSSAFLNNTPIVAMLIPVVLSWCRRQHVAPSKLLIPLSFMTILGGTCSRIGTSTNLVVDGLMTKQGMREIGFFEISKVGVPCAIIGVIYMITIGRKLLPERKELLEQLGDTRREYLVEMLVSPVCRLVGQSIEAAGLRRLPGLFLIEVDRRGTIIAPVSPDTVLEANDRLVFTGVVETIVDLKKIQGLEPVAESTDKSAQEQRRRTLCEVVVSPSSPLVGQTVRDAQFRSHYNAAIVAIHRNGARLTTKIGDVKLEAGDTLLMQTGPNFVKAHRNNPDFYLVSDVEGSQPVRHEHWWIALLIFVGLLVVMFFGDSQTAMLGAFVAGGLMIATRCMSASDGRHAVDWQTLVAIGASFGLGEALRSSGAALYLSTKLVAMTEPLGPYATLAAIYFVTMILNELITNNAAAALAFPFCLTAAELTKCDPRPFAMCVALAASFAFASPIGYQTHMMVFGAGGYKFTDFVKVGLPLNLLLWVTCVILIPMVWPF